MRGKYTNYLKYLAAKVRRTYLRMMIHSMINWHPMEHPDEGYTAIIGVASRLKEILKPNLHLLLRQDRAHLKEVILVFDTCRDQQLIELVADLRSARPDIVVRDFYYTKEQSRLADRLSLPYVYSWASWCIGLRECRTRYALLHDYDAFLLNPQICEDRYLAITQRQHEYVGIRFYSANGIETSDKLVTTFEMIFDADFVRKTFCPIDLFNQISILNGKSVDFDTTLYAQTRAGASSILPIPEQDMVHPSQVIHQFTQFSTMPNYIPPAGNNLLMIPYLIGIGQSDDMLVSLAEQLVSGNNAIPFFDKMMDASRLSYAHALWLEKQALRLEQAVYDDIRPSVRKYFEAIRGIPVDRPV